MLNCLLKAASNSQRSLIILHGLFGNSMNWSSVATRIAASINYNVLCLDLRNHGKSFHSPLMDFNSMAHDVSSFIQAARDGKINDLIPSMCQSISIMGHSMGGRVAMQLACNQKIYDQQLDKLIVVDVSPSASIAARASVNFLTLVRCMKQIVQLNASKSHAHSMLRQVCDEATCSFLMTNFTFNPTVCRVNLDAIESFLEKSSSLDASKMIPFKRDTLFIKGNNSSYIKEEDEPLMKHLFPSHLLKGIDNAGHWVHVDKPKEFIQATINFLEN